MNPTLKMALVASCKNCNETTTPIYRWEMFRRVKGEKDFKHNDTLTLKRFASTDIMKDQNLVIKANALSEGDF